MSHRKQIATFPQNIIKSQPIIFSLYNRNIVRQIICEKYFEEIFQTEVKIYSIQENGERKALLICYYYMLNDFITVVNDCKIYYSKGEQEAYKFTFLAFIKNELVKKMDYIFSDKKYQLYSK